MKLLRTKAAAVCALVCLACVAVPVAALAAALSKPKLTYTLVEQDSTKQMTVFMEFHVSKADSVPAWKAKVCAVGKCKTVKGKGLGSADATATTYTPNVVFKADELHKKVKATATLTIGAKHWTYTKTVTDEKNPCGVPRLPGSVKAPAC